MDIAGITAMTRRKLKRRRRAKGYHGVCGIVGNRIGGNLVKYIL
jgi:hypothetical protein